MVWAVPSDGVGRAWHQASLRVLFAPDVSGDEAIYYERKAVVDNVVLLSASRVSTSCPSEVGDAEACLEASPTLFKKLLDLYLFFV